MRPPFPPFRKRGPFIGFLALALAGLLFVWGGGEAGGGTDSGPETVHRFSVPRGELERRVMEWLQSAGYHVRRWSEPMGPIRLTAVGAAGTIEFWLRPRSPLAAELRGRCPDDAPDCLAGLWQTLSADAAWVPGDEAQPPVLAIPEAVRAHRFGVVCISARGTDNGIRFTGFLVDPAGLVLTTAHGFTELGDLRVTFPDGREEPARVFRRDSRRDLILLSVRPLADRPVSLTTGRSWIEPGEPVFSIVCSAEGRGRQFHGGTADGPPRMLEQLPVVPLRMEILPGSSGSPVFDAQGRLLGMIKGRFRGTATIGFLIPMDTIMAFLRKPTP